MSNKTFETPKGTFLQLVEISRKEYLPVAQRVIWFREEKPEWGINTELVKLEADSALFKCWIVNEKGQTMSTAHKTENERGFTDFMEKAETGSIGRALALIGYGTQFAIELDEGSRIVDAPQGGTKEPNQFFGSPVAKSGGVTEAQLKRLYAITMKVGINLTPQIVSKIMDGVFGIDKQESLNRAQYDDLVAAIEEHKEAKPIFEALKKKYGAKT